MLCYENSSGLGFSVSAWMGLGVRTEHLFNVIALMMDGWSAAG